MCSVPTFTDAARVLFRRDLYSFYIECMTSLDKDKLEKALNSVIKEQPSLRSYITSDGMQCCMDEAPEYYRIKETDISRLSYEEQEKSYWR